MIRAIRCHCVIAVCNGHDQCTDRHFVPFDSFGIPFTIGPFVVITDIIECRAQKIQILEDIRADGRVLDDLLYQLGWIPLAMLLEEPI